ncbi:hypothetical protein LINGRAHAP2_LOCUS31826 [Linum grandiflorum]
MARYSYYPRPSSTHAGHDVAPGMWRRC